jgi:FkbM family methyltransferase
MAITAFLKQTLPPEVRAEMRHWLFPHIMGHRNAMRAFSLLMDFYNLRVELLPENKCVVRCHGRDIVAFRDGFRAYGEIFGTKLYEARYTPQAGDIIIDAGAYVGMFSYRAARLVGETGMVIAVEPDKRNIEVLEVNLKGIPNIKVVNAALSNTDGWCDLFVSDCTACHSIIHKDGGHPERVPTVSVDSLVEQLGLPRVDMIKMDIEGAEVVALEGSVQTLRSNNTKLAIASYHALADGTREQESIQELLAGLGYVVTTRNACIFAERR